MDSFRFIHHVQRTKKQSDLLSFRVIDTSKTNKRYCNKHAHSILEEEKLVLRKIVRKMAQETEFGGKMRENLKKRTDLRFRVRGTVVFGAKSD